MKTLSLIVALFIMHTALSQGISYSVPDEVYYRSFVKKTIRYEPPQFEVVFDKSEGNFLYFRVIPKTQTYVMVSRKRYTYMNLHVGDTMVYDNRPDIYYRIKQTRITRATRRFKR